MKKIITQVFTLFCFSFMSAQSTIPNSGFENWDNNVTYENPQDWGTTNDLTALVFTYTATKATGADVHGGNYALKLETKNIFGQTAPGIAATGTVTQNTSGPLDFEGIGINFRPAGISGWFKYTPAGTDTGSVEIWLYKWNSAMNRRDAVGSASFEVSTTVSSYTHFVAPVDYVTSDVPDTAVIILLSGSEDNSVTGSKLIVDDLAYEIGTSVPEFDHGALTAPYPNPSSSFLMIESLKPDAKFLVYDSKGSKAMEMPLTNGTNKLSTLGLQEGIYFYQLFDGNTHPSQTGRFFISR